MDENRVTTGGCLCGAVRYRVNGPIRDIVGCHCKQCRKTTGHWLASANVWRDQFELTEQRGLKWYRASDFAGRGFCSECGATLFWRADVGDTIGVAAGTLDRTEGLRVQGHIFTDDKGDYYALDPALPNFPQSDDGEFPMPDRDR